jgi:hypothetical protein
MILFHVSVSLSCAKLKGGDTGRGLSVKHLNGKKYAFKSAGLGFLLCTLTIARYFFNGKQI